MATPTVNLMVVPTGGATVLQMPDYFNPQNVLAASGITGCTVARAVSGTMGLGTFTTLYSGAVIPTYVDVGDCLSGPLLPSTQYVYQVADARGTTQIGPVAPGCSLVLPQADPLTNIFTRLLQAGLNNVARPPGLAQAPQVTTEMPQGGLAAMPFVTVNLELFQQSNTGIGQDIPNVETATGNTWTIWITAKRVWRVSVLAQNVETRDFLRDAIVAMCQTITATVWNALGLDKTHDIQFTSGPSAETWEGRTPGFYFADIMVTADGTYNSGVVTGYGYIEEIQVTNTADPNFLAQMPITAGPMPPLEA